MSRIVKGIGSVVGFASEAIADHKEKKAQSASAQASTSAQVSSSQHNPDLDEEDLDDDSAQWALDEAGLDLSAPPPVDDASGSSTGAALESTHSSKSASSKTKVADFLASIPHLSFPDHCFPLPEPVILPQRRPQSKSRGFIRAYAPSLDTQAGIDQATFLAFLDSLDMAAETSSVFTVINVAGMVIANVPSPIAMGASFAMQVGAQTAIEVQSRSRRNNFLDDVNDRLFRPRGLYCMMMIFKPDAPMEPVLDVDLSGSTTGTALATYASTSLPDATLKQKYRDLRLVSGKTVGEVSLPPSAELIYPALDAALTTPQSAPAAAAAQESSLKAKWASTGALMSSYLDRRAAAEYADTHGGKLAGHAAPTSKPFASRYADPNHPANSGTLLGLLTGGAFDPRAKRRGHTAELRARVKGQELSDEDRHKAEMGRLPSKLRQGVIRKGLKQNVLYLTVVNLPSEDELRAIRQALDDAKDKAKAH